MKTEIITKQETFEPVTIQMTCESLQEVAALWLLTNISPDAVVISYYKIKDKTDNEEKVFNLVDYGNDRNFAQIMLDCTIDLWRILTSTLKSNGIILKDYER